MAPGNDAVTARVSPGATLFVVAAAQFLTPFMFSAVGVALPTIGREFGASAAQLGLVEAVYIFAVALLMLPVGRFADIHGRRRVFIAGVVVITLSTVVLAMSPTIVSFILVRFVQGVGAALISSSSVAILSSVFPASHRGRAMGVIVAAVYTGLSLGPTLAGMVVTHWGWRWVFWAAVPLEVTALVLTLTRLRGEWAGAPGERFDWRGSFIFMAALFLLVLGAAHLKQMRAAPALMLSGILGLTVFVLHERRTPSPLLDLRLLTANRTFSLSNIATWINYAASFGVTFFLSLYLQSVRGYSPQAAGLILVIQPLIQAVCSPLAGRLADRHAPARIATMGMGLCAAGLTAAAFLHGTSPLALVYTVLVLMGLGFGFFASPNMTVIMASVAPRHYGVAASLAGTMRTTGMLTSMTLITVILTIFMGEQALAPHNQTAFVAGMRTALVAFSVLSVAGIFFSLGRIDPDAIQR